MGNRIRRVNLNSMLQQLLGPFVLVHGGEDLGHLKIRVPIVRLPLQRTRVVIVSSLRISTLGGHYSQHELRLLIIWVGSQRRFEFRLSFALQLCVGRVVEKISQFEMNTGKLRINRRCFEVFRGQIA